MALQHLARTTTVDEVAACVREHGHVTTNELVPVELMNRTEAEPERQSASGQPLKMEISAASGRSVYSIVDSKCSDS